MAQVAAIAAVALMAVGTVMKSRQIRQDSQNEAAELKAEGIADLAAATRAAAEERKKSDWLKSRLIANVAAGGGDTTDKTVVDLMDGIDARGEFNMLSRLYEGESSMAQKRRQSREIEKRGKRQADMAFIEGAANTAMAGYTGFGGGGKAAATGGSKTQLSKFGPYAEGYKYPPLK